MSFRLPLLPLSTRRTALALLMGLALGAVVFISEISHWIAISQTQAAYMIALKRTSILFAVLYGAWLFREEHVRERLVGALIMLCGVVCIAAFG